MKAQLSNLPHPLRFSKVPTELLFHRFSTWRSYEHQNLSNGDEVNTIFRHTTPKSCQNRIFLSEPFSQVETRFSTSYPHSYSYLWRRRDRSTLPEWLDGPVRQRDVNSRFLSFSTMRSQRQASAQPRPSPRQAHQRRPVPFHLPTRCARYPAQLPTIHPGWYG